jgi:hypothetical protein
MYEYIYLSLCSYTVNPPFGHTILTVYPGRSFHPGVFVHYFQAYHQANLHYMPSLIMLAASCMKAGCVGKFTLHALFNHARCVMHEGYLCSSFIFLNPGQCRALSNFIHRGQFMHSSHSTSCQTIHPSELICTCTILVNPSQYKNAQATSYVCTKL